MLSLIAIEDEPHGKTQYAKGDDDECGAALLARHVSLPNEA